MDVVRTQKVGTGGAEDVSHTEISQHLCKINYQQRNKTKNQIKYQNYARSTQLFHINHLQNASNKLYLLSSNYLKLENTYRTNKYNYIIRYRIKKHTIDNYLKKFYHFRRYNLLRQKTPSSQFF